MSSRTSVDDGTFHNQSAVDHEGADVSHIDPEFWGHGLSWLDGFIGYVNPLSIQDHLDTTRTAGAGTVQGRPALTLLTAAFAAVEKLLVVEVHFRVFVTPITRL